MSICGWVRDVLRYFYPSQLADAMRQQDYADQLADVEAEVDCLEPISPTGNPPSVGDGPPGVEPLAPPGGPPTYFWDQLGPQT